MRMEEEALNRFMRLDDEGNYEHYVVGKTFAVGYIVKSKKVE